MYKIQGIKMRFDLDKIYNLIQPFYSKFGNESTKNVILFLGKTGAGKSTTINYLLEYKLKPGQMDEAVPFDLSVPPPAAMGDSVEAITIYPTIYATKRNISLCDCPGFQDTRGIEIKIATLLCMQMIATHAKSLSYAIVMDYQSIIADRSQGLRNIALQLGVLFNKSIESLTTLIFIINRYKKEMTKERLLTRVKQVIEAEEKGNKELTAECLSILKLMYSNPNNIILIDVFDNGKSRNSIFFRLKWQIYIRDHFYSNGRTQQLNFVASDPDVNDFKQIFIAKINQFNKYFEEKAESQRNLSSYDREYQNCQRAFELIQTKISSLRQPFDEAKDYEISQKRAWISANEETIRFDRIRLNPFKESKEQCARELAKIDTEDVIFYQYAKETYRDNGVIYNTQVFEYKGIPFERAEPEYVRGNFSVTTCDERGGEYEARFDSNHLENRWARVKIYCKKKLIPSYAVSIKTYKDLIRTNQNYITQIERNIEELQRKNDKYNRDIQGHIAEKRRNIQQQLFTGEASKREKEAELFKFRNLVNQEKERIISLDRNMQDMREVIIKIKNLLYLTGSVFMIQKNTLLEFSANCSKIGLGSVKQREIHLIPSIDKDSLDIYFIKDIILNYPKRAIFLIVFMGYLGKYHPDIVLLCGIFMATMYGLSRCYKNEFADGAIYASSLLDGMFNRYKRIENNITQIVNPRASGVTGKLR